VNVCGGSNDVVMQDVHGVKEGEGNSESFLKTVTDPKELSKD
jgi:hypothetical protein